MSTTQERVIADYGREITNLAANVALRIAKTQEADKAAKRKRRARTKELQAENLLKRKLEEDMSSSDGEEQLATYIALSEAGAESTKNLDSLAINVCSPATSNVCYNISNRNTRCRNFKNTRSAGVKVRVFDPTGIYKYVPVQPRYCADHARKMQLESEKVTTQVQRLKALVIDGLDIAKELALGNPSKIARFFEPEWVKAYAAYCIKKARGSGRSPSPAPEPADAPIRPPAKPAPTAQSSPSYDGVASLYDNVENPVQNGAAPKSSSPKSPSSDLGLQQLFTIDAMDTS